MAIKDEFLLIRFVKLNTTFQLNRDYGNVLKLIGQFMH